MDIRFSELQTRRTGRLPFTTVTLVGDVGGAPMRIDGANTGRTSYESDAVFPQRALEGRRLVGAPHALLASLVGPLGERLAALRVAALAAGPPAMRLGASGEGIVLRVRGWPANAQSISFVLDTVLDLRAWILATVPRLVLGARTLRHHPEVERFAAGRQRTRSAVLAVLAFVTLLATAGTAAAIAVAT